MVVDTAKATPQKRYGKAVGTAGKRHSAHREPPRYSRAMSGVLTSPFVFSFKTPLCSFSPFLLFASVIPGPCDLTVVAMCRVERGAGLDVSSCFCISSDGGGGCAVQCDRPQQLEIVQFERVLLK